MSTNFRAKIPALPASLKLSGITRGSRTFFSRGSRVVFAFLTGFALATLTGFAFTVLAFAAAFFGLSSSLILPAFSRSPMESLSVFFAYRFIQLKIG